MLTISSVFKPSFRSHGSLRSFNEPFPPLHHSSYHNDRVRIQCSFEGGTDRPSRCMQRTSAVQGRQPSMKPNMSDGQDSIKRLLDVTYRRQVRHCV